MIDILLVDDDEDDYVLTKELIDEITQIETQLAWVASYQDALAHIEKAQYDVYLIDYRLGHKTGIDLIKEAIRKGCKAPLILLTGKGHIDIDYEAMRVGATDYLIKDDIDATSLERTIRYALQHTRNLQALEENEKKYRALFDKSIDAIYVLDTNKRFIDANSSLLELLGYEQEEFAQMKLKDIFEIEEAYNHFWQVLSQKEKLNNFEATLYTKNKETLVCQLNGVVLTNANNETVGYQGIIRDMSEQKKAEVELLAAEKLSTTGKLARTVAHEIRNPLTNLHLALEELKHEIRPDSETTSLYFDIIKRNIKRIENLLSELLHSSKPKQLSLEKISIDVALEESLQLVEDRLQLLEITLEKQLNTSKHLINIDKERLKIAFCNILVNAIEAMADTAGILKITTQQTSDHIVVKISDNGVGIAPEDVSKLFDPFFTNKNTGMGLGLTSTKTILNSHKAKVRVESTLGEGTTFCITFPCV